MENSILYPEFNYNISLKEELSQLREQLLTNHESAAISGENAAKLLINYDLFAEGSDEQLHLAIMSAAETNGQVRRYLDYLSLTLTDYLPRREELLATLANHDKQSGIALYQSYCAFKDLFLKLQEAQFTTPELMAVDVAQILCHKWEQHEQLAKILLAFDRHECAGRAIDQFLSQPLTQSAPQRAKLLAADFLNSLAELKRLNYPLFYDSLSQFVSANHNQASKSLALLLSAERLYHLDAVKITTESDAEPEMDLAADLAAIPQKPIQRKAPREALVAAGAAVLALGLILFIVLKPSGESTTAAAQPAVEPAPAAVPAVVADAATEKTAPIAQEIPDNSPKVATIYTASSAGVKACSAGPLTSADCPEAGRGFLNKGTHVTILKENEQGWSRIEAADGKVWWVFSGFLKGEESRRLWRPVATKKTLVIFDDQEMKKPSKFVMKEDTSACARQVGDNLLQIASPTTVMGYIAKNKLNF